MIARRTFALAATVALFVCTSTQTHALINAGAEAGIASRSAEGASDLGVGWAVGLHAELSAFGVLAVGPYYLHYELPLDSAAGADASAKFNAVGARARLFVPLPLIPIKPFAYIGAGYTAASYPESQLIGASRKGGFVEVPIGLGIAYNPLPLLQLSLEGAYRPGFGFHGKAYDNSPQWQHPGGGWTGLLGVAIDL